MSVDLSFEATWGGASATSYLSVEDSDEIAELVLPVATVWTSISTVTKSANLLKATRAIESMHYIGEVKYTDQLLKWPRIISHREWASRYSTPANDDVFQRKSKFDIQVACLLEAQARYMASAKTDHSEMAAKGIKQYSKSVGPIREQYTYGDQGGSTSVGASAMSILRNYTRSRGLVRG